MAVTAGANRKTTNNSNAGDKFAGVFVFGDPRWKDGTGGWT
jgi:hypothetical protein